MLKKPTNSATCYMGVFNTTLHAQPFQGGFRYLILLGDLPETRQVGYVAIGESRGHHRRGLRAV